MPSATAELSSSSVLTLPRATIATLSPSPFLTTHLVSPDSRRANGRSPDDFRSVLCNVGSLTHCAGSAVVRVGDTAVVCGIQAEILLARDIPNPTRNASLQHGRYGEIAQYHLVIPNVELATGCSPAHLPGSGGPPSQQAQALSARLLNLLLTSRVLDIEDLSIRHAFQNEDTVDAVEEVVAYWTLYPSVHVLSLSGGVSLFDIAWGAMLAALRNLRLPKASWNVDLDSVVCSDLLNEVKPLKLQCQPVAATWSVFIAGDQEVKSAAQQNKVDPDANGRLLKDGTRAWLLADPDDFEEQICSETVTIVLSGQSSSNKDDVNIITVEKSGGTIIGIAEIQDLIAPARKRWREWTTAIP